MNITAKVTYLLAALVTTLVLVLVAISLYSFQNYSLAAATEHLRTTSEIVRVSLTESMINGVIDKREGFLRRLTEVQGLRSTRIARSPLVTDQFGAGLNREAATDELERKVLRDGKAAFEIGEQNGEAIFRGTIPFIANGIGTPNCMQCHKVQEGAVLGAITMTMSIEHLKTKGQWTVAGIVGAVALFALLMVLLMRNQVRPIAQTALHVEKAVQRALNGDFKANIEQRTDDEIGKIAGAMNRLLGFLDEGLNRIGNQVTHLTERKAQPGENLLTATIDMVDGLARAAHFKKAIEEDESKSEIYQRLTNTLRDEFAIVEMSLYEVSQHRNQMTPMLVDGESGASCRWCDQQILFRTEACRVRRTGHIVDSIASPGICNSFRPPSDAPDRQHICYPIIQSGAVGSILQVIVAPERQETIERQSPYIGVYLRECSPVLEAKRLMETLRESNLRDPMTGLNNRRFLEEFVETLVATVQRRKTSVSILMLDLDYFKMVNDTHGHDAGDTVLKALAKSLQQSVRASDIVIRYGGEEFIILLIDAKPQNADLVAETIRARVAELKIQIGATTLQKTISIGISDYPGDSDTFWQAVKYADVALYKAKNDGRNRVIRFKPEMWTPTGGDY